MVSVISNLIEFYAELHKNKNKNRSTRPHFDDYHIPNSKHTN